MKRTSASTTKTSNRPAPLPDIHAGITGARCGNVLRGSGDASDVLLRIVDGTAYAPACWTKETIEKHGDARFLKAVVDHLGCSFAHASLAVGDFAVWHGDKPAPNHLPLGAGCAHHITEACECPATARFVVISQGRWQQWAEDHGHGAELEAIVAEQRPVTWKDILGLMHTPLKAGGKLLACRVALFEVVRGPATVAETDPRSLEAIDAVLHQTDEATTVYDIEGHLIRVAGGTPFPRSNVLAMACAALNDLGYGGEHVGMVDRVLQRLSPLSDGALKSLMQKAVRFHAPLTDLRDAGPPVATSVVCVVAILLLFSSRGTFSPELQLFTRGCSAALKRLAVILLEDSFVPNADAPGTIVALVGLALVCQRVPDHHPSREVILAAAELVGQASMSSVLVTWRSEDRPTEHFSCSIAHGEALRRAAVLMRIVRSFGGDMDMFDTVARMAATGSLGLCRALVRPKPMPVWHCVDQHAFRGVAHAMQGGSTFEHRFKRIFEGCTGVNPRSTVADVRGFDERNAHIRFAQRCCGEFALRDPEWPVALTGTEVTLPLGMDPGVLAAGVGPISVRLERELIVLLGLHQAEDEMVMLRPVRATRDLFGSIKPAERKAAIATARSRSHPVHSPLLPGSHVAVFHDGCWHLDDRPWYEVVAAGSALTVPHVLAPAPLDFEDASVYLALRSTGVGMVDGADQLVAQLVTAAGVATSLRAASLLRQQYTQVLLPTPGLDGKLGSDQLAAYAGDWHVWRLLCVLSRLLPGALRATMPPHFAVQDARLLRHLEGWIVRACHSAGGTRNWGAEPAWQAFGTGLGHLIEHQKAAVARMEERDAVADTGHFLVMDTGLGKTVTSLTYAYRWLCRHGSSVDYVLWITPHGTTENLCGQLRGKWDVPVWLVPRVSASAKSVACVQLKRYHVNVIHADHLRTARGLSDAGARCFVVVDEVDEMYAPTLRTSGARRVAQLAPKFVAQTATPVRKTEAQLQMWLRDTCAFPVTDRNMLVAASGMVSMQMELKIAGVEQLETIPMEAAVREGCLGLGRAWMQMARLVQDHTDEAIVSQAVRHAVEDRRLHPAGGVLLVADSSEHVDRLVERLESAASVDFMVGRFESLEAADAAEYGVVVVTKKMGRGYNSAVRLGRIVTGVYAGNGAARHQMRGRLRRIGQQRSEVLFVTVVMENTILHVLHERQGRIDTINISLRELGQTFAVDVMAGLE